MNQIVINGDNIELLKNYPDNYFDAVVTDPPYGLGKEPNAAELMKDWIEHGYHEIQGKGFMGKEWDAFIPQPVFWKEVFRVLKHGGHVVAFYGTRTYDWGVMSMRFAGFEVRDCIQWLYGSGFPKSHNISKAIDKMPKANSRLVEFSELLKQKRNELNLSIMEADELICEGSTMYNFLEGRSINGVLKIYPPNKEFYEKIKSEYKIEGWDDIVENNLEVIGQEKGSYGFQSDGERWDEQRQIKKATTDAAKQWDGWGTALKPANEPIVLARKPLEKGLSIAENILKWGVGGINIDASRIGFKDDADYKESTQKNQHADFGTKPLINNTVYGDYSMVQPKNYQPEGRFPANIILTHHEDCVCKGTKKVKSGIASEKGGGFGKGQIYGSEKTNGVSDNIGGGYGMEDMENWDCHEDCPIRILDEQSGDRSSTRIGNQNMGKKNDKMFGGSENKIKERTTEYRDKGGASRFFYVAKASKSERNKGLDGFEEKENKNFHPTVKPIKLMQYLVKMITPPNGIVLDPFCGSGTTGVACKLDGFQFVGLEQDPEYAKIAEARINNYVEEKEIKKVKEDKADKLEQIPLF